jgi:hypothetical protein
MRRKQHKEEATASSANISSEKETNNTSFAKMYSYTPWCSDTFKCENDNWCFLAWSHRASSKNYSISTEN